VNEGEDKGRTEMQKSRCSSSLEGVTMRREAGRFFVVLVENDQVHFPPYRPFVCAARQMQRIDLLSLVSPKRTTVQCAM
jgi:hypothetical protein